MTIGPTTWRIGASLLAPFLPLHLQLRVRRGKEIAARLPERYGHNAERPPGRLFWLHAASVGETMSALPVLEAMAVRDPALQFLITTGTVTSASLLERRLSPALASRSRHRFLPLDVPGWATRFLEAWRPDAGAFVESELWPNLLAAARSRGLPLVLLLNARMSPRSAARWRRAPRLARAALGAFVRVLARSEEDAARLSALGAPRVACWGDLKSAAAPLPVDAAALAALRAAIGGRKVFVAAQTHPGEEAMAVAAHRAADVPGLLTIIVPRHPERGSAIAAEAGPDVARRGAGEMPGPDTQIYVADTLGELGLFYRVADVALVGGSLVPHGGQNPLEPARLGCPILFGPHMGNFAEPVARLLAAGGAVQLAETAMLAPELRAMLSEPGRARSLADAAAAVADRHAGLPDRMAAALLDLLPTEASGDRPPQGMRTRSVSPPPEAAKPI